MSSCNAHLKLNRNAAESTDLNPSIFAPIRGRMYSKKATSSAGSQL